jgi:hypothetical protein
VRVALALTLIARIRKSPSHPMQTGSSTKKAELFSSLSNTMGTSSRTVKAVYQELLGRPYTGSDGVTKPLALEDYLIIAPYNAQVRALQAALPAGARVGNVEKFQGQEAPICILSLCSSYGGYGSRGLAFILDRNRVNVALSRAKCLAVVVADPRIGGATAGTIDEMLLLNLFCKPAGA